MKEATTPTIRIHIAKIENIGIENIEHVTFIFKPFMMKTTSAILTKRYPDNVTFDSDSNCFYLDFSESETRKFDMARAYMDTKIVLNNGKIPETSIVQMDVKCTLFGEDDDA